jgi:hypothetical protein
MKKLLFAAAVCAALGHATVVRADDELESVSMTRADTPMVEVIDVPTAETLEPATFATTFRFYDEGGITSRLNIGPFRRVNLGIHFDVQNAIGRGEPDAITPRMYFKLRAFDGNDYLPALALGYDGQGYLYKHSRKDFLHEEKGAYIVGSHEIFVPNLELHMGVNVNDFEHEAKVYGFLGSTFKLVDNFALLLEYDNIRNGPDNRFNAGGRFYVTPYFNIDFGARNIGRKSDRGAERIVRINYTGRFPF